MKVLIDTCVVIDFLQKREPFADDALRIFRAAASELLSAISPLSPPQTSTILVTDVPTTMQNPEKNCVHC